MGIDVIRTPDRRIHVLRPQDWGEAAATDYWANWGNLLMADAAALDLVANGWLTNGFSHLEGSLAGFLDSSDAGTTGGLNFDAVGDYITSPFIFGDYAHGKIVEGILGHFPTVLNMEVYARFVASSGDENETGFGFIEAGGSAITTADEMAYISIGASAFELHSGAAEDAGATKATTPHLWKIAITKGGSVEWFIDGTSQGSIAIQADLWPVAFSAGNKAASGANKPVISWVHIWYA